MLSGATARQLRYWEDHGLVHSYVIGSHRRYLPWSRDAGALMLAKVEQARACDAREGEGRPGAGPSV